MPDELPDVEILYEEGPCLVVCKPGGLLTQAPPGIDSLEVRIKQFLKIRDQKPGRVYLGVPHRIDRPASGALVVGKHARAARRLSEQFERRLVRKFYWALVDGMIEPESGTWRDHLRKIPDVARAEVVHGDHPEAREAVAHYKVLARRDSRSLLQIELETGRTHQIRVQTSSRGIPICGDEQYGSPTGFGPAFDDRRDRWIALHARQLEFHHPMTQENVTITAPLPAAWREAGIEAPE